MTKKLADFFNIDQMETADDISSDSSAVTVPIADTITLVTEQLSIAKRIDEALPQVRGLDIEDRDFDDYAQKAMDSYDKLMDLGFNVDDRNAGKIFEVASTMMGNAITAKTAKLDKKLKMIELQLKAAKLSKDNPEEKTQSEGELTTDRNAILNLIAQNLRKNDK